jgi:hypothetical protein
MATRLEGPALARHRLVPIFFGVVLLAFLAFILVFTPWEQGGERARTRKLFVQGRRQVTQGEADAEFAATALEYPESLEAHKSRYKRAVIAMRQGRLDDARRAFAELADRPDGPLAPEARMMHEYLSSLGPPSVAIYLRLVIWCYRWLEKAEKGKKADGEGE